MNIKDNIFIGGMERPIYECRIGGFVLESFRRARFPIRQNELRSLKFTDLPKDVNLIVCDSNSLPEKIEIQLVIMVKRVDDGMIRFIFEESSQSESWASPDLMEDYFHYRRGFLSAIQRENFSVVITKDFFDFDSILLQYGTDVPFESMDEIINLAFERLKNIQVKCTYFASAN